MNTYNNKQWLARSPTIPSFNWTEWKKKTHRLSDVIEGYSHHDTSRLVQKKYAIATLLFEALRGTSLSLCRILWRGKKVLSPLKSLSICHGSSCPDSFETIPHFLNLWLRRRATEKNCKFIYKSVVSLPETNNTSTWNIMTHIKAKKWRRKHMYSYRSNILALSDLCIFGSLYCIICIYDTSRSCSQLQTIVE